MSATKKAAYVIPTDDTSRPHLFLELPRQAGEAETPSDVFRRVTPHFARESDVAVHDDVLEMPPDLPLPLVAVPARLPAGGGHMWLVHRGPRRVSLFFAQLARTRAAKATTPTTAAAATAAEASVQQPVSKGLTHADREYLDSQRAVRPPPRVEDLFAGGDGGGGGGKKGSARVEEDDGNDDDAPVLVRRAAPTGSSGLDGSPAGKQILDADGELVGTVLDKSYTPPHGFGHKMSKEEIAAFLAERNAEDAANDAVPFKTMAVAE